MNKKCIKKEKHFSLFIVCLWGKEIQEGRDKQIVDQKIKWEFETRKKKDMLKLILNLNF